MIVPRTLVQQGTCSKDDSWEPIRCLLRFEDEGNPQHRVEHLLKWKNSWSHRAVFTSGLEDLLETNQRHLFSR